MCLLVLAWRVHPRYPLVVAANRDEFHERPAAPLDLWREPPEVVGGRDLRAGGTWLAVDARQRFGVVTNFRERQRPVPGAPSRGELIPGYLGQPQGPAGYLAAIEPAAATYSAFNLLLADADSLWYASNRTEPFARALPPGVYGLSNHLLDTPWPKLERIRGEFRRLLDGPDAALVPALLGMLQDRQQAGASEPELGGLSPEWERILSSPFVLHSEYGTRCSTVVLREQAGMLRVAERRFDPAGEPTGETEFELNAGRWRRAHGTATPPAHSD